jgi:hypothetical protein
MEIAHVAAAAIAARLRGRDHFQSPNDLMALERKSKILQDLY